MQKVKKIPQRQCVGCREMKDKRALIRAVKSPQGEVSLDFTGKKPGRGAYVCPNSECLKRARKSRALERALDTAIPESVYEEMEKEMARLILIASDAADNTRRRALHFGEAGECICLEIPPTKEDLGRALGRTSCALLALTDIGFAEAVAKKLAESDEAHYGEAAKRLTIKAARAAERRKELKQHPRGAVKHGRTRAEREKAHRAAEKQRAARRFAHSRPVKKGKGSIKKDSKQRSQHTEVQ